jgi:predicted transcriptional regulator
MELLCDLLFELSSGERMNIMLSLKEQRLRLSHVAQRLEMTVTEASRQLQRLSDAQLVSRDTEGLYGVTSFGELALFLLSGLGFASKNRQYFLEHNVSLLPQEFRNRIGELSNCEFDSDTVRVFEHARKLLLNAKEYIWIQSYQHLLWNAPIILEKMEDGVDFRFILPENTVPPPEYEHDPAIIKATKTLERVASRVLITEEEASLSLPYADGRIDYTAFMSRDPIFLNWCRDLFLFSWERARSIVL